MSGLLSRFFPDRPPALRVATSRDAAALAGLHAGAFHIAWDAAEFERLLADRLSLAFLATDGPQGAPIGFILTRGVLPETEILSVAVAPRWRGRGLGRQLVEAVFGRLAAEGYTTVFLEVEEGNAAARKLYARAGFREIGRRSGYYRTQGGVPAAALTMRRDIA
ncbi:GNAT family N-acetyltransferase [Ancylobacter sp. 6x-1]|uniref:GNAT family N-acetyltransferase n=1 Tax=Ancylobacter crimeensis TaxID=2579147 RepID=A0ABT0DDG3_9HYPH|nr:GNAT family N-acetyltransferase [Ancylobacter crimeensis]MCK0198013.1 GNAT family N-acetyltransferase [Ancylobacter crimeensis]